jgi:6-phosphogluconolactonase
MKVEIFEPGELAAAAADRIATETAEAVAARGVCRIGLSGGGTPRPVYQALARPPLAGQMPWDRVELFWGDERCVPPDDPASNYRMACEAFIEEVPIPAANVHRIEGERPPEEAAAAYAEVLGDEPIDILLLGIGADGHTASLFPGTPHMEGGPEGGGEGGEGGGRSVIATISPAPPAERVSLTLGAINRARTVYFLVAGADKAGRLAEIFAQIESGAPALPAARVQPASQNLIWLLDRGAAGELAGGQP